MTDTPATVTALSEGLTDYWQYDLISVLDDVIQLLTDEGHEDLADEVYDVLMALDSRRAVTR